MLPFKTWSADRTKKKAILVQESENLLPTVSRKGRVVQMYKLNTCDDATPPITHQQNEGPGANTEFRLLSL